MRTRKLNFARFLLLACILLPILTGCQSATQSPSTGSTATSAPQITAVASSTQGNRQPGGNPPGGTSGGTSGQNPGAPNNSSVHSSAAIYVSNGSRASSSESTDGSASVTGTIGNGSASGVLLTSNSYTATGLVVANNSTYSLGGDSDTYSVYSNASKSYVGTTTKTSSGSDLIGKFDSVLLLGLNSNADSSATTGSSGIDVGSGSTLRVTKVYVQVDGAGRYAVSNYDNGTLIVNDSTFVTTGDADGHTGKISAPFSNEKLLISGLSRTSFSVGATKTYYFNSNVIAQGWAALSTDSATGSGLDLYAYNTKASALDGGYGTYADTNCRVWLYGTQLTSAEIGAIIAKTGQITVADGASAGSRILAYNTGATTSAGSTVTGGRNAVMIHTPDMTGQGTQAASTGSLTVANSNLATSKALKSTYDYSTYSKGVQAYVDHVSGDVILVKSTSASIDLTNTQLSPYNGVLVHTVLNNDNMGNFLKAGDNTKVDPVSVKLTSMTVAGDILHDDYQRDMKVTLEGTALTGAIRQGTYKTWKALWSAKGVSSANWLQDTSWSGSNTLSVTVQNSSTWTVTGDSSLTSLTIANGASVTAPSGKTMIMTVNGVEAAIKPGAYTGTIVISIK